MIYLRKKQWVKVTAFVVLILFSFDSFSTPALLEPKPTGNTNLQVQSVFFAPIIKEIGWERRAQVEAELAFILAMAQTVRDGGYVNSFDVNAELDKMAGFVPGRRRILDVTRGPFVLKSEEKHGEGIAVALIRFKENNDGVLYELKVNFKNGEKISLDGEDITLESHVISKDPNRSQKNEELTKEASEPELIERPLDKIPQNEVRNILVYSDFDIDQPKVGEETINLWPLVSSLHSKYPDSIIYVASAFPDVYLAEQFKGKVRPFPRNLMDIAQWGYKPDEWEHFRLELMAKSRYDQSNKATEIRKRFVDEKGVDMIFDVSVAPGRFGNIDFDNTDGRKPPYIFAFGSATSSASAIDSRMPNMPIAPEYTDRSGKKLKVAGFSDMFKEVAPSGNLVEAGIWELSMGTCRTLGLNVSREDMGTVTLSVKESLGAMTLLKKWYSEGGDGTDRPAFDPSKKIIVVNVYAITQADLIDREMWIMLIQTLTENINDAYFVFTRGGQKDRGTGYVEEIARELKKNNSNIITPRVDIYPHINDILGIASGLVTLDTGLSHVGNGVYNIPTAIITKTEILHWLTPRNNVYPLLAPLSPVEADRMLRDIQNNSRRFSAEEVLKFKRHLFTGLINSMIAYSKVINSMPERPEARAAKVAAAQSRERARLDEELIHRGIELPDARSGLEDYIKGLIVFLGMEKYFAPEEGASSLYKMPGFPEIVFVDSSKQTGVGLPRFGMKLYTSGDGKTYLLVDVSVVVRGLSEDGKTINSVRWDVRRFDAVHEIFGHVLARSLFPEFTEARKKLREIPDNVEMLDKEVKEEALACLMTVFAIRKLAKMEPAYADKRILDKVNKFGINLTGESVDFDVHTILDNMVSSGQFESISTLRYKERLMMDPKLGTEIEARIKSKYLDRVKEVFEGKTESTPQIGKRTTLGKISIAGNEAEATVVDSYGDTHVLKLEKRGKVVIGDLRSQLLGMLPMWAGTHKDTILDVLRLLEKSPPTIYTFNTLVEDLFGFAVPEKNAIVVHEELLSNPLALFHEICEYLVKNKEIRLVPNPAVREIIVERSTFLGSLLNSMGISHDLYKEIGKIPPDDWTRLEKELKNNPGKEDHYYLRGIQRELFHAADVALSKWIRDEQLAIKTDPIKLSEPVDVIGDVISELERGGKTGESFKGEYVAKHREAAKAARDRGFTVGRGETEDEMISSSADLGYIAWIKGNRDPALLPVDFFDKFAAGNEMEFAERQNLMNFLMAPENRIFFDSNGQRVNLAGYLEDYYRGLGVEVGISLEKPEALQSWELLGALLRGRLPHPERIRVLNILNREGLIDLGKLISSKELMDEIKYLFSRDVVFPVVTVRYNGRSTSSIAVATRITDKSDLKDAMAFVHGREDAHGDVIGVDITNKPGTGFPLGSVLESVVHEIDHTVRGTVCARSNEINMYEEGSAEMAAAVFARTQSAWMKSVTPDWYGYLSASTLFRHNVNFEGKALYYTAGLFMAEAVMSLKGRKGYFDLFYRNHDPRKNTLAGMFMKAVEEYLKGKAVIYTSAKATLPKTVPRKATEGAVTVPVVSILGVDEAMQVTGMSAERIATQLATISFEAFRDPRDPGVASKVGEIRSLIDTKNIMIAMIGRDIVGFTGISYKPGINVAADKGTIKIIVVTPEAQRKGAGQALLDMAVEFFIAKGITHFELTPTSLASLGYYVKNYFPSRAVGRNVDTGWSLELEDSDKYQALIDDMWGSNPEMPVLKINIEKEMRTVTRPVKGGESLPDGIYDARTLVEEKDVSPRELARKMISIWTAARNMKPNSDEHVSRMSEAYDKNIERNEVLFALRRGRIIGFCDFQYEDRIERAINMLAVEPSEMSNGVGRALIDRAIDTLLERYPDVNEIGINPLNESRSYYLNKYFPERDKNSPAKTGLSWYLELISHPEYDKFFMLRIRRIGEAGETVSAAESASDTPKLDEVKEVSPSELSENEVVPGERGEEDRVTEVIKDAHREDQRIIGRDQNADSVRGIIQKAGTSPIDIIVDLSLIPENDIDENMKSWACLVLSCIDMPNVNFIFEKRPEMIGGMSLPEKLENMFAKAPESSTFLAILRKEVRSSAGSEAEVEKLLNERVRDTRLIRTEGEEPPIEVLITSKEFLSWVSSPSSGVTLRPNQYPVALEGEGVMPDGKIALRNFEAAVSLALSRAALVIAKRRVDKGESGAEELYGKLKKQLLPAINRLYAVIFGEDINLTEKTLDNMVYTGGKDGGASVRINLAIKLALPSMTYMEIEKLREMHATVQIYLRAA